MTTFGFIGAGNMGGALAKALCQTIDPARVTLCDLNQEAVTATAKTLGCKVGDMGAAAQCDCVFLGVKPQGINAVMDTLKPLLKQDTLIVSMAVGVEHSRLSAHLPQNTAVIRIMPNTPVGYGAGMILACPNAFVTDAQWNGFCSALDKAGKIDRLDEKLIDAGGAVSGCGPAFAYLFIEALADGAVACGLPRDKAQLYAAQTLLGAAKTAIESGKHPGALKDAVCSPGGTTIAGVEALEQGAFRATAANAVIAAYDKTQKLK